MTEETTTDWQPMDMAPSDGSWIGVQDEAGTEIQAYWCLLTATWIDEDGDVVVPVRWKPTPFLDPRMTAEESEPLNAINYVLDELDDHHDKGAFLHDWREGDVIEWPEYRAYCASLAVPDVLISRLERLCDRLDEGSDAVEAAINYIVDLEGEVHALQTIVDGYNTKPEDKVADDVGMPQ